MKWEGRERKCVRVDMILERVGDVHKLIVRSTKKKASERVRAQCERNVGIVVRVHSR